MESHKHLSKDHLTMGWLVWSVVTIATTGLLVNAQDKDEAEQKLCADKSAGELFRLKAGDANCRDVIQCTASGLQAIRCPPGLAFDLVKKTNWLAETQSVSTKTFSATGKGTAMTDLTKMLAIVKRTPTVPPLVIKKFANCLIASALKMELKSLETFVPRTIDVTTSLRWSWSHSTMPSTITISTFMQRYSTKREETLMVVTSRRHSSCPINTQTIQPWRQCTG